MARIPDAELARLKREVSLERLATARGIVLKPSGKNLMGLCPFHEDHEPSLSIDPGQNLWHCFGCQQGGGVIDWGMRAEGVSFRHAVELLRTEVVSAQCCTHSHHQECTDCEALAGAETDRVVAG